MLTHCIPCAAEAALSVRVDDCDTILCPECGEEFTTADVEERIGQMRTLVRRCHAARAAMGPHSPAPCNRALAIA